MKRFAVCASAILGACIGSLGNQADPTAKGGSAECDEACRAQAETAQCLGTEAYFREYSWPEVFAICVQCHTTGKEADGTRFILKPDTIPNYIALNMQVVTDVMQIEQDGTPLMILKSTNSVAHNGGRQISAGSKSLAILEETIARLKQPVVCPDDTPPPRPVTEGVILHDPYGTLRKASWQLVGRPPTPAEVATVDQNGLAGVESVIDAQMNDDAFYERLREIFGDVLLTDGYRANNTHDNTGNIINSDYFPSNTVNYFGLVDNGAGGTVPGQDYDWRYWNNGEGIRLVEALAREPVEFVVYAVKNDLPMSEILTGKYRLLNSYSARFLGVPLGAVADPQAYVKVTSVPGINENGTSGEYAGILTTTAFLNRYPSSPTNFNRKRARFTYKYFLNFDIMKTAPRIDASAVDLDAHPTKNNPQCTGCHSQIDPLAGAFMNEDECGYDYSTYYGAAKGSDCNVNGWVDPQYMFPPGVSAAAQDALSLADRPKALEKLAAHIVTQPGFAEAIASQLYVGLMGRSLLQAPADPSMPGYASLDAAFNAEKATLQALTKAFSDGGLKLKPLVKAIVKSEAFRAKDADDAARLELFALGGGALTNPEILNRKIISTTGFGWYSALPLEYTNVGYQRLGMHDGTGEARLLQREQVKTLYGGLDGSYDGVKSRQRLPSTLTAAIVEHMALEVSCLATNRDFDKPTATRLLFPKVEKTLVVSGNASAADQAPIIDNLRYLHERFFGERLAANDPEILASYDLLKGARDDHASAGNNLERPCKNDVNPYSGAPVSGNGTDANKMIRAWQAVIAFMLMDYRFVFEQ